MAPEVHGTLDSLLDQTLGRERRDVRSPLDDAPGKSGAALERLASGGDTFVLKRLDRHDDWTIRVTGRLEPAPITLWRTGILDRLPACFDQPIIGCAHETDGTAWLLMRDISAALIPADGSVLDRALHDQLLDHMAELSAAWWERADIPVVVEPMMRYLELSPWMGHAEAALDSDHVVPRLVLDGWERLAEVAPDAARVVVPLAWDPSPLVAALDATPQTFVHGNWKLDNLGAHDGRTVIFDWETPGRGTACGELAWHLAINCDRLPVSKEAAIETFRIALERRGIDTASWWDRQLALSLLGGLVHFGWEKALGERNAELEWWEARAIDAAARYLDP